MLDSTCRFDKRYVYAPEDDDSCVRPFPKNAHDLHDLDKDRNEEPIVLCKDTGEGCPLHHCCDDGLNCGKYHFCGKEGRRKTRLRRKLLERQTQRDKCASDKLCIGCGDGGCKNPAPEDVSLAAVLAFVEGFNTFVEGSQGEKGGHRASRHSKGTKSSGDKSARKKKKKKTQPSKVAQAAQDTPKQKLVDLSFCTHAHTLSPPEPRASVQSAKDARKKAHDNDSSHPLESALESELESHAIAEQATTHDADVDEFEEVLKVRVAARDCDIAALEVRHFCNIPPPPLLLNK